MLDQLPAATRNFERTLKRTTLDKTSAIQKLTAAATAIESAAAGGTPAGDAAVKPPPSSLPNLRDYLWTGTSAAAVALGQAVIILALSYFLLISDHAFKRKLMRITGSSLHKRKITVKILAEIDEQIQRYLLIQLLLSIVVGVLTGGFLAIIGLENAIFWGVAAGFLHFIPYIGPTFAIFLIAAFAFLQFDSLSSVFVAAGGSLLIVGVIGLGVLPWITGRTARISAISTFVGLLVWDWLWGVPGLLLGIPIMMAAMAVCERVEGLRPIAELMNRD
jgi:predicted PurR-regulated permease PerM